MDIEQKFTTCIHCGKKLKQHIIEEGARYHVISWSTSGRHCNEKDCEINHKCEDE